MRASRRFPAFCLATTLCAALAFAGCGRKETAPLSEGGENSPAAPGAKPVEAPLEQQTEQKLDPLSKDDNTSLGLPGPSLATTRSFPVPDGMSIEAPVWSCTERNT